MFRDHQSFEIEKIRVCYSKPDADEIISKHYSWKRTL